MTSVTDVEVANIKLAARVKALEDAIDTQQTTIEALAIAVRALVTTLSQLSQTGNE